MFTITVSAMPAQSVVALRSMLHLLEPALGSRWQVVDQPPADVVLLPAETLARLNGVAGAPGELPIYLALSSDDTRPPNAYATLKRPITPPRLVEALNKAEGLIERLRSPQDEMQTVPLIESFHSESAQKLAPGTFDARVRTSLRAATWRLLQDPIAATLINDERQSVFSLLPGAGYHTRLTPVEFAQVFRDNGPSVLIELSPSEQEALKAKRDFKPLRELEWVFWLCNKSPWLRPELSAEKKYRLRRWPDFGRLPHYQGDLRLASFLMSQPLALQELRERACVPLETAMNFLNATYAVGVLAEANETAPAPARAAVAPPVPGGIRGLIANLRRKLGLGSAPAAAAPATLRASPRA